MDTPRTHGLTYVDTPRTRGHTYGNTPRTHGLTHEAMRLPMRTRLGHMA